MVMLRRSMHLMLLRRGELYLLGTCWDAWQVVVLAVLSLLLWCIV